MVRSEETRQIVAVRYRNNFWDLLWFQLYLVIHNPFLLWMLALVVGVTGWWILELASGMGLGWPARVGVFAVAAVGWLGLYGLLTVLGKNRVLSAEANLVATEDGLLHETELRRSELMWKGIEDVRLGGSYILIFTARDAAFVIPRRAFPGPPEVDGFLRFVSQRRAAAASEP